MVPSITTSTRKDGSKHKHRYYVCGNFHNKGSSACKSNSIRAYDAEEMVIIRLADFLSDTKLFTKTLEALNKQTVKATIETKNEIEVLEQKLIEVNAMQERYMEAFEKNLFPVAILQERLQKIATEKAVLEHKRNELSIHLSSSDSKVISPDLIRMLLEKYMEVLQHATRDKQKHLFQLLLNNISVKNLKVRSRSIDKITLEFDFTEVNISNTFTLIHLLYQEAGELPDSNDKLPPYLQLFLPLFVVRFTPINPKRPINLLH
ncbi:zinc ribbon domain-containing protein [Metabacillus litoralis]|nr:zinc ribbon domain-containing protein [Metabacillus litoralis]